MSWGRPTLLLVPALVIGVLLAGCTVEPTRPAPQPVVVIPHPEPPPIEVSPLRRTTSNSSPWTAMTASFALHDCADAPLIRAKEAMYTRSPKRFEALLQRSLPLMDYVHGQLHEAGIPGEFVMLPMLESSYHAAEPSRHNDAAGMWQLMPRTARLHGIETNPQYDGRRDPVASTAAAIAMLKALHQRFGDWRLVDMAYNAGPYAILRALRRHPELGDGPIPAIPVSETTRNHLAKLMALSCIVRDPARFQVKLPEPSETGGLAVVQVPAGTRLSDAADMAELPETTLRALNPGYLGQKVPADSPRSLLLPAHAATALLAALTVQGSDAVAQVDARRAAGKDDDAPPLPLEPVPSPATPIATTPMAATPIAMPPAKPLPTSHRVGKGETLWSIAHRYGVSMRDLRRWNDLKGNTVRVGEVLSIRG